MEHKTDLKLPLPPTTKDVLGVHLHQKVSEALNKHFPGIVEAPAENDLKPTDRITGMLLERSETEIRKMLQDEIVLLKHVNLALRVCEGNLFDLAVDQNVGNSYEELGEILFEKVSETEGTLAPQITGMLLELDARTLLELLSSETLLKAAVDKAREALASTSLTLEDTSSMSTWEPSWLSVKLEAKENRQPATTKERKGNTNEILKEACGMQLLEEISKMYPKDASKITGMILELDLATIQTLLRDRNHLMAAVAKAHSALHSNT